MTLEDLTKQESGIIIYHDSKLCFICNWSNFYRLPQLFMGGLIDTGKEIAQVKGKKISGESIEEIIKELAKCEIYDFSSDNEIDLEKALLNAMIYKLDENTTIIAPKGWN